MALKALHDSILFSFYDEAVGGGFNNKTESGIVYKSIDADMSTSRWALVLAVGDKCTEVKVGDSILIENLKWTEGCTAPEIGKIWRTTEEFVLCIRDK